MATFSKEQAIIFLIRKLYCNFFRFWLKKQIDDPEKDWDDAVIDFLDEVFNCE